MTLVNEKNRTLDDPCDKGFLGTMHCTKSDYQSWRRIAIGLRQTMLWGEYVGEPEVYQKVLSWLGDWVRHVPGVGPIEYARAYAEAIGEGDPDIDSDAIRFPGDVSWWYGHGTYAWDPSGGEVTYNDMMGGLEAYLRAGESVYETAEKAGTIRKKSMAIEQAEERPPPKLNWKPWFFGGLAVGAVAFGTWVYSSIVGVRRKSE